MEVRKYIVSLKYYFTALMTPLNFVYYSYKLEWREARATCQSLGGDLATIDSGVVMDSIVSRAVETYGEDIL
jgi:hypothetical protein